MLAPEDNSTAYGKVQAQLFARWPENRVAPDLGRISALMDLLGDPHRSAPVIHIAGTNGKTSTSRIIESLLRSFGLSTGLFTSPALDCLTERVQVNGKPVSKARFVAAYQDIAPYLSLVDQQADDAGGLPVTMFEALTALGFACFADAPVDVMVIECGMGGTWDATNVVRPEVTVVTPIGMDHMDYLGDSIEAIAAEKAGILFQGASAAFARQEPAAAAVLMRGCVELNVTPAREGLEFAVTGRSIALGGQQLTIQGLGGEYDDIYLPLHGQHQATNAGLALVAVEMFLGAGPPGAPTLDLKVTEDGVTEVESTVQRGPLNPATIREGMAQVTSPGRLERVRTSPTVVVDAAHNPHGAKAAVAAIAEAFDFGSTIVILAMLAGKDALGVLEELDPIVDNLIVTVNSSPRCVSTDDLAHIAISVLGDERVLIAPNIPQALEVAFALADEPEAIGSSGIVALGSVVTAADVRRLLRTAPSEIPDDIGDLVDDEPGGRL